MGWTATILPVDVDQFEELLEQLAARLGVGLLGPERPRSSSNEGPALHAAVHAWMEGRIEAESRAGTQRLFETAPDDPDPMPSPPFPDPHAPALAAIVDELSQRFATESDAVAAVFVATGLGYQAGLRDGAVCPGCTTRSGTPNREIAARVRAGLATVMLVTGKATSVTLTE